MVIKYYKNEQLSYATRNRYKNITLTPFAIEEQRSVLLGDGASTTLKTKVENICDYVVIDDTRWFVTSFVYTNGGQVRLFLQRDVIGEKSIQNCYGKIERGFTDGVLKRRKELDVNQILKSRKYLQPNTFTYGNATIDTHDNELWGILYLTKPTAGSDKININIPGFSPVVDETLEFIEPQEGTVSNLEKNALYVYNVYVWGFGTYKITFKLDHNSMVGSYSTVKGSIGLQDDISTVLYPKGYFEEGKTEPQLVGTLIDDVLTEYVSTVSNILNSGQEGFALPKDNSLISSKESYNDKTILYNNKYYSYNVKQEIKYTYFDTGSWTATVNCLAKKIGTYTWLSGFVYTSSFSAPQKEYSLLTYLYEKVSYTEIVPEDAGVLALDITNQLVSEPFYLMCFPLFNTKVKLGSEEWNINRDVAFTIFNTVVQYLSGENGYLVDAQVYPYCPPIYKKQSEFKNPDNGDRYPFFSLMSSTYNYNCPIDLEPFEDIKKEYICREYSIVSPEQSKKYSFNFYDYKNNKETLTIQIKTSLKPYTIIASAIILRDENTLAGLTYQSDLRGCQPTGNGFECSLSTDQFQQYVRNNSNYEKIFSLDQEALEKQHQVEKVNDTVSGIVNTISAAAMGTIGGASLGGSIGSLAGNPVAGGIGGAIAGGTVAAGTVGTAMAVQNAKNQELREYEEKLQKEKFNLTIGTIKNLPNVVNRISSFNEIILKDFWFCVETYECTEEEISIVERFIDKYAYGIGVYGYFVNFIQNGKFVRGSLISSSLQLNLHEIAKKEFAGGIYLYEQI